MARYGTFKYGTAETYGASAVTEAGEVTWVLQFDWSGNGSFDGTNEANRLVDFSIRRGNEQYISTSGRGFAGTNGGTATLIMDNYDRRFDPRNTSSPLSPNVDTGKEVYIGVIVNATQTRYDILRGQIGDIRPISGKQQVRITVLDYTSVLENTSCGDNASGMMLNITSAFVKVFHSVNIRPGYWVETDAQPVPIFDVSNKNAGSVCNRLAEAALGYFFTDKLGIARFYGRNHAGYTDHAIGQAEVLKNIIVSQPWDYIFNHISVKAKRPIKKQTSVIYFLPNPVYIASGGTKTFHLSYPPSSDVSIAFISANSKSTGDGVSKTLNLSATSFSLGTSGGSLTLSASANLWVTGLEVRGRTFDTVEEEFVYKTAASITARGLKQFSIDNEYLQDPAFAEVFAEALRDALILDRESIIIEIEDRPATQFSLDIMHTVTFTAAALDISGTYYITGYEHDWVSPTGQVSKTTVWLHKLITCATAITPSRVEEENIVPTGYQDPGGDPDTPPAGGGETEPTDAIATGWIPLFRKYNATTSLDEIPGSEVAGNQRYQLGGYWGLFTAGTYRFTPVIASAGTEGQNFGWTVIYRYYEDGTSGSATSSQVYFPIPASFYLYAVESHEKEITITGNAYLSPVFTINTSGTTIKGGLTAFFMYGWKVEKV